MGLEKDLPPGEQLLVLIRPFLEHLAASDLSPKTIQKHVDNIWVLGGEFIRDLHNDPSLRKKPVDRSSITAAKISRDRPIPPAESSAGSSPRRLANASPSPTNSPDEASLKSGYRLKSVLTLTPVIEADILAAIMNRLLLLTLAFSAIASAAITEPVKIDTGLISGTTTSSDDVRVFKGIPFAAPPVGDLRWRAPQPAAHWDGVRKADQFGPVCMQQSRPGSMPAPSEAVST